MQLKLATWNINSVRLRIDLVAKFIKATRPDILCLQETKCPDDAFPRKRFKRLGYDNVALNGQKGYHGVVVLSRLPFQASAIRGFCGRNDCRHLSIMLGERAGLSDPITLHNLYVPAGGDIPDPARNPKFAHKLAFLDEMALSTELRPARSERSIMLGDLNVAPLECDVWSHKQLLSVVSHTPIECEKLMHLQKNGGWIDAVRSFVPAPVKLFTWWSYRSPDWGRRRQRPPARSHLALSNARRSRFLCRGVEGFARLGASVRPCTGDRDAGIVVSYGLPGTEPQHPLAAVPELGRIVAPNQGYPMHSPRRRWQRSYGRFRYWQEKTREPGLTALLFIEGALLFAVTPLVGIGWLPHFFSQAMFALLALATLVVTSRSRLAALIVLISVIASPVGTVLHADYPSILTEWLSAGGRLVAIATLSVVIAKAVFGSGRVTWHRVQGAIVLYMNFALFFFIIYQLIDVLVVDAFTGLPQSGTEHDSGAALLYFSFCNLTTANFGDITPLFPLARNLSNLESMIGQLFPATLLARLVTLEFAHRRQAKSD